MRTSLYHVFLFFCIYGFLTSDIAPRSNLVDRESRNIYLARIDNTDASDTAHPGPEYFSLKLVTARMRVALLDGAVQFSCPNNMLTCMSPLSIFMVYLPLRESEI